MIAIVSGSRNHDTSNDHHVWRCLDKIKPNAIIVGSDRGIDGAARRWARDRIVPCATVEALWDRLGTRAGPIRNRWMMKFGADTLILFPGGVGTNDMHMAFLEKSQNVYHVSPGWEITSNART